MSTGLYCVFERGQPLVGTLAPGREKAVALWKADRSPEANGWRTMEAIGEVRGARVQITEDRS